MAANSELESARKTIADLEQTLSIERQHWGHYLAEIRAEQRILLNERLAPLLKDAIDALEIDPPARKTAIRRIKSALAVIKKEIS